MKRVLYGTTALVAAGLLVTSVSYAGDEEMMEEEMMAAPVSVGVGGYYRVAFGGYSGDGDDGNRGHYINQNIEINVAGSTTLDNGITAGVNIWLDAMNGNGLGATTFPKPDSTLSGAFGTLTLGSFESAAQLGTVWAPGGNGNFGIKSPFFNCWNRVCRGNPRLRRVRGARSRSVVRHLAVLQWHLAQRQLCLTITRLLTVVAGPRMMGRSPK